jgi:hypothetical protein
MNIKHKSTKNITEYHFDLIPDKPELACFSPYVAAVGVTAPSPISKVTITFENGKFSRCDFPFKGTYTREQWSMLAEIESEIHRIELSLLK